MYSSCTPDCSPENRAVIFLRVITPWQKLLAWMRFANGWPVQKDSIALLVGNENLQAEIGRHHESHKPYIEYG